MNTKYKIVAEQDGKEVYSAELGHSMLSTLVNGYTWREPPEKELINLLSQHEAWQVRQAMASQDDLEDEVLERLAKDSSWQVLDTLIGNASFQSWADLDLVLSLIEKSPHLASDISNNFESFSNSSDLVEALAKHPDPEVRANVAGNRATHKKILKILALDSDAAVRKSAQQTLDDL